MLSGLAVVIHERKWMPNLLQWGPALETQTPSMLAPELTLRQTAYGAYRAVHLTARVAVVSCVCAIEGHTGRVWSRVRNSCAVVHSGFPKWQAGRPSVFGLVSRACEEPYRGGRWQAKSKDSVSKVSRLEKGQAPVWGIALSGCC